MYFQHATVYIWSFCHFDFTTHLDFSDMIGFFSGSVICPHIPTEINGYLHLLLETYKRTTQQR